MRDSTLYVRRFSLKLIRDLIGNQCSDLSRGLDSFLFYIFRSNRTAKNSSSQGDCSLEHWLGKLATNIRDMFLKLKAGSKAVWSLISAKSGLRSSTVKI